MMPLSLSASSGPAVSGSEGGPQDNFLGGFNTGSFSAALGGSTASAKSDNAALPSWLPWALGAAAVLFLVMRRRKK
jgi:hypothetical protein